MDNSSDFFEGDVNNYTTKEIANLLKKQINSLEDIDILCEKFQIDKNLLKIMVNGKTNFFSCEMYEIASKVLNISFDELTDFTYIKISRNELAKRFY